MALVCVVAVAHDISPKMLYYLLVLCDFPDVQVPRGRHLVLPILAATAMTFEHLLHDALIVTNLGTRGSKAGK